MVAVEQTETFTFSEWIRDALKELDEDVVVTEDNLGRVSIRLNGDWHIATLYAPPTGLLGGWLDAYPRALQIDVLEKLIKAMRVWHQVSGG